MSDPERIWLSHPCQFGPENRVWCDSSDPVTCDDSECPEGEGNPTEYIRADIAEQRIAELTADVAYRDDLIGDHRKMVEARDQRIAELEAGEHMTAQGINLALQQDCTRLQDRVAELTASVNELAGYCYTFNGDTHEQTCNGCNQVFGEDDGSEGVNEHAGGCPIGDALKESTQPGPAPTTGEKT